MIHKINNFNFATSLNRFSRTLVCFYGKSIFYCFFFIAFFVFTQPEVSAQLNSGSAGASAFATIVIPISIEKGQDLHFGRISLTDLSGGTVSQDPSGNRISTGGITLINVDGVVTPATFEIGGLPLTSFSVVFPSTIINLMHSGPFQTFLTLTDFQTDLQTTNMINSSGSLLFNVGGTLNVPSGGQLGMYTGSFEIMVSYQ